MKKYLLVVALLPTFAYAQAPQPNFTPYTVNAQEHQAILNYLGEQPAKFAVPLINQFNQMEQQAQTTAAEAAKKKAAEGAKKETNPIIQK